MRSRTRTGLVAAIAALTASIAIGTAVAAPIKNAEKTCAGLSGTFASSPSQYACSGTDPTKTFSFFGTPQKQCVRQFKGIFSIGPLDFASGAWSYTCDLP